MNEPSKHWRDEDEIDLLELIGIFWLYRYLILGITFFSLLGAIVFVSLQGEALHDSNAEDYHFRAEASVYFPIDPITEQSVGVLGERIVNSTNTFNSIVEEFDIFKVYAELEGLTDLSAIEKREIYDKLLEAEFSDSSGVLLLSFFHPEEEMAQNVLEKILELMASRLSALGHEDRYTVLESASIVGGERMNISEGGSRTALYLILSLILGFMLSVFLAIVLNFIRKVKSDPEALRKLKGA